MLSFRIEQWKVYFFQATNDMVEKSLSWQLENAKKSVQDTKNEVIELEQVLDCAITDLASNESSMKVKEIDVIKGLFNRDSFPSEETQICLKMVEVKIGKFQQGETMVLCKLKNDTKYPVSDVKLVLLNDGHYKIKYLHDDLDKIIDEEVAQGICDGFGINPTTQIKVSTFYRFFFKYFS